MSYIRTWFHVLYIQDSGYAVIGLVMFHCICTSSTPCPEWENLYSFILKLKHVLIWILRVHVELNLLFFLFRMKMFEWIKHTKERVPLKSVITKKRLWSSIHIMCFVTFYNYLIFMGFFSFLMCIFTNIIYININEAIFIWLWSSIILLFSFHIVWSEYLNCLFHYY